MPSDLDKEFSIVASSFEDIDLSLYNFVDNTLNLHTTTNKGIEKVPIIWVGSERAFQIKNNRDYRDSVGKLRLPLISIERASVEKDKSFKGNIQAHVPVDKDVREYPPRSVQISFKTQSRGKQESFKQQKPRKRKVKHIFRMIARNLSTMSSIFLFLFMSR